jgi:hypothetical protein
MRVARVDEVAVELVENMNIVRVLWVDAIGEFLGWDWFEEMNENLELFPLFLNAVEGYGLLFGDLGDVLLNFHLLRKRARKR